MQDDLLLHVKDDDDAEDLEEGEADEKTVLRETRRAWSFAACVPLLALSLEQSRDSSDDSSLNASPGMQGSRDTSWVCTLSLVGFSAAALSPPAGVCEPLEGSMELHHIALQTPGNIGGAPLVAVAWGSPLARSPLEADEPVVSSSPASAAAGPLQSQVSAITQAPNQAPYSCL